MSSPEIGVSVLFERPPMTSSPERTSPYRSTSAPRMSNAGADGTDTKAPARPAGIGPAPRQEPSSKMPLLARFPAAASAAATKRSTARGLTFQNFTNILQQFVTIWKN